MNENVYTITFKDKGRCNWVSLSSISKEVIEDFVKLKRDINELKEYLEVASQRGGMSHIHQYFVSTRNKDDVKQMVKLLIKNGYTPLHGISNIDTINPYPVGITIDNKVRAFWPNSTTIMACYISSHHARPLDAEDVVDNFDMLINNLDIIFYNKLLLKKNEDYEKQKKMPK